MRKIKLIIWSFASLWILPSSIWAAEIWGYPISPTQAKFYLLILYTIAFSILMVASAYFLFWILDLRKKAKGQEMARELKPALVEK